MKTIILGASKLRISAIGQGTGGYGRAGMEDADYIRLLKLGIDLGLTLIDTAEIYANGKSEELVGQAMQGVRDQVFLATKMSPQNCTHQGVLRTIEASLKRLKTDYVDLYQIHWPNPAIRLEETMGALNQLIHDGKVRFVGVSNFLLRDTNRMLEVFSNKLLVGMQQEYSLLARLAEETFIPYCREKSLTFVAYSPLAQGRAGSQDALRSIAQKYGITSAQLALQWIVREGHVAAIPQTTKEEHLRDNAAALNYQVDKADLETISKLFEIKVDHIPTDAIRVIGDADRAVYTTLEEAIRNPLGMVPSAMELAERINCGEFLKPVKVRWNPESKIYELTDGRTRYWAWIIAHRGQTPIPALVEHMGLS